MTRKANSERTLLGVGWPLAVGRPLTRRALGRHADVGDSRLARTSPARSLTKRRVPALEIDPFRGGMASRAPPAAPRHRRPRCSHRPEDRPGSGLSGRLDGPVGEGCDRIHRGTPQKLTIVRAPPGRVQLVPGPSLGSTGGSRSLAEPPQPLQLPQCGQAIRWRHAAQSRDADRARRKAVLGSKGTRSWQKRSVSTSEPRTAALR